MFLIYLAHPLYIYSFQAFQVLSSEREAGCLHFEGVDARCVSTDEEMKIGDERAEQKRDEPTVHQDTPKMEGTRREPDHVIVFLPKITTSDGTCSQRVS